VTLQIGDRNLRYFEPRPTEVLVPKKEGRAVLAYEHVPGAAAVATLKDRAICTAVLGFPLEELAQRDEQAVLAAQFFVAMGLKAEKPPAKPSTKSKGDIEEDDKTTTTAAAPSVKPDENATSGTATATGNPADGKTTSTE
jgi:hypothetical protein